jgi:GLPGLI family protein
MKNGLLFIAFALFLQRADAQEIFPPLPRNTNATTVDSGNIRILYALNATDIKNPETYEDLQRLETGVRFSKYYSDIIYRIDSLGGDINGTVKRKDWSWSEYHYSEYFKDFSTNTLTEYVHMPWGITSYQCSENISSQNWELHDDTLSVGDYLCQKATCRFRGRDFTAWFAADIPINNGPWKFGGLPGLILKVYDNGKLYVFECVKIENHTDKYLITLYDGYKTYGKTEHKKLIKLLKNIHEDYRKTAGIISLNRENSKRKNSKIPYHPLELE